MFKIAEIARKLDNIIRIGTVTELNGAFARVEFDGNDSALLPFLASRAGDDRTWTAPSVGEQVLVLSPGGDTAQGVILMALYQDASPAPSLDPNIDRKIYADGTVITYDKSANKLTATLCAGGTMDVTAPGGFKFTGDIDHQGKLTVSETITATGDIKSDANVSDSKASMVADRTVYNKHTHPANATIKPTQQMAT
jgi:phage baseplate assembly protein V